MKHKRLAAAVLAAALWLTGCGGAAAPAAPAGSGAAAQSTADTAVQTAQKDRITEQFTLEKTIRDEYGITQKLTIHVPQLVCDSPDAAYLNEELAAMYAADFRQYEDSPEIEPQQDEWSPKIYINWDAYWYGDCVSLVVFRYDGGTDPIYSQGWCFDFAAGHKLSPSCLCVWGWTRMPCSSRCCGRPCRPLTGTWRRAATTRACSAAAIWQACG